MEHIFLGVIILKKIIKNAILPPDAQPKNAHIELVGNCECIVDGCKGIIEYTNSYIKLSLGEKIITFTGDDLNIISMNFENVMIEGNILQIEFCS